MRFDEAVRALALGDIDLASARWQEIRSAVDAIDARTEAIATFAALVALGAGETSYAAVVDRAPAGPT